MDSAKENCQQNLQVNHSCIKLTTISARVPLILHGHLPVKVKLLMAGGTSMLSYQGIIG